MTFDLATAKARLNIPVVDVTKDASVQLSLDTALALAETYCNRKFTYAAETATFHYPFAQVLQLSRYPLEQVVSVTSDTTTIERSTYQAVLGAGQVKSSGWMSGNSIDVTYAGGYKILPPDLLLALWGIFDKVWAASSGGAVGDRIVNSIQIPDVGTVKYESPNATAAAPVGLIPATSVAMLDFYRLEVC